MDRSGCSWEEWFEGFFKAIGSVLIVLDCSKKVVQANPLASALFGCQEGDLIGKELKQLFPKGRRQEAEDLYKKALDKRNEGDVSSYFSGSDGVNVPVLLRFSPILDRQSQVIGILAHAQDERERKKLESQILHGQKLESIGQLAAGVAHEINTPMQYIGDNLEFLESGFRDFIELQEKAENCLKEALKTPPSSYTELRETLEFDYLVAEMPKALEQTRQGVESVTQIVRSLKALSHPDKAALQLNDLNQAIQNAVTVSRNEWKYVAEVELKLDPALTPISCYLGELSQVFLNMIVNAAHAVGDVVKGTDKKGTIRICTSQDERFTRIAIEDTGTGIPSEIQDKIYNPFFTTKAVGKGTGQGLAIAYRVINERHKGKIQLNSRPGFTQFLLELPKDLVEEAIEGE